MWMGKEAERKWKGHIGDVYAVRSLYEICRALFAAMLYLVESGRLSDDRLSV
jgi:hypothetical protein